MMIIELLLLSFWILCVMTGYRYFKHLFNDLKLRWTFTNRASCALICLAGPAGILCGLAVDYSRPMLG